MLLRLIHLEDDINDRELIAGALRADGIVCTVTPADSRATFESALADGADLILSDFSLPGFDGIAAQQIASTRCPDVPFVFVSGSIADDVAVERLKSGATDYVLKHRLERLPSAVRRAIQEAEDRRKRTEAEHSLRQLNAELESRVAERTSALRNTVAALDAARAEAERANHAKSEFLSRMSHDLRTPLNAIMGFAQMLQLGPASPEEQEESATQILRGGRVLLGLINEVLDIARIEAGRMSVSPEPLVVAEVIDQALELVQPLAAARGIGIEVDVEAASHVFGDRQRLTQILLNLLSNAVKYNRASGTIRVTAAGHGGERVRIAVADTGRGIAAEKLALLFMPFERLGAEQTDIEGTGLGLALAKGLAEVMGGSLTVTSVVDEGSTFQIELPSCEAVAARGDDAAGAAPRTKEVSGMVLYVEDNLPNVMLMRRVLSLRPGIELAHAKNGRLGLEIARERQPDLVILDSHLPDIAGEEVLHQLWAASATRHIPVAILSADATPARQRHFLAAGAIAYLTKPFDVADLLRLIDNAVGGQEAHT